MQKLIFSGSFSGSGEYTCILIHLILLFTNVLLLLYYMYFPITSHWIEALLFIRSFEQLTYKSLYPSKI